MLLLHPLNSFVTSELGERILPFFSAPPPVCWGRKGGLVLGAPPPRSLPGCSHSRTAPMTSVLVCLVMRALAPIW